MLETSPGEPGDWEFAVILSSDGISQCSVNTLATTYCSIHPSIQIGDNINLNVVKIDSHWSGGSNLQMSPRHHSSLSVKCVKSNRLIGRTCICHKNISIDTFHYSFKLNWKLVALKLLFIFIEIIIKGEDCWFPVTCFHAVSCTILCYDLRTILP